MKKIIFIVIILTVISFAQGPGQATNPNPPDSSEDILWFYQPITWINPPTATSNKVLIGIHPEYLTELHSGSLIDSFVLPSPLEIRKTYYWRVDEIDSTGISEGDIWLFTTKNTIVPVFIDSFSAGLNYWVAYNDNDSCGWKIKNLEGSYYDLPPTSETYGVRADNYSCGNNRIVSVLELANPPDLTNYTRFGIGWDNDLKLSGSSDSVYVEVSKNGAVSWTRVWERVGRNQRKSQEEISFLEFDLNLNIRVRFRSSLENIESWWAIDNFYVWATDLAFFQLFAPSDLTYDLNIGDSLNVLLYWQPGGAIPSQDRYRIQRKLSDSLDQYAYFTIGETDLNTLSFLDNTVKEKTKYSYRVGICEGPIQGINSYPVTLITDHVTLVEFENGSDLPNKIRLHQNYPNPFNPSTTIRYEIPEQSFVTLKVYDILGNEIATLVNDEKPVGSYEVEFSAKGGSASGGNAYNLSSGIYFYKLSVVTTSRRDLVFKDGQAGSYIQTKKMLLLK